MHPQNPNKLAARVTTVVVRFSKMRGRFERKGLLVEPHAPLKAQDQLAES
jgi:hypothetical protein